MAKGAKTMDTGMIDLVEMLITEPEVTVKEGGAKLVITVRTHRKTILALPALQEEAQKQGKQVPLELFLGMQPIQIRQRQDIGAFRKVCADKNIKRGDVTGLDRIDMGLDKEGKYLTTQFTVDTSMSHLTRQEVMKRDFLNEALD